MMEYFFLFVTFVCGVLLGRESLRQDKTEHAETKIDGLIHSRRQVAADLKKPQGRIINRQEGQIIRRINRGDEMTMNDLFPEDDKE